MAVRYELRWDDGATTCQDSSLRQALTSHRRDREAVIEIVSREKVMRSSLLLGFRRVCEIPQVCFQSSKSVTLKSHSLLWFCSELQAEILYKEFSRYCKLCNIRYYVFLLLCRS